MAMEIAIINTTMPSTTGNQSYTASGFGTPQGAIVFWGAAHTTANPATLLRNGFGFTDGTSNTFNSVAANSTATSASRRDNGADALVRVINTSGTSIVEGDFNAWVTDGIQINWATVQSTTRYFTIVLIKGCTNIDAGQTQLTTTGVNSVSLAFKPNLVLLGTTCNATTASAAGALLGFGAAHNSSTDTVSQGYIGYQHPSGTASDGTWLITRNDSCIGQMSSGTQNWKAAAENFTTGGFDLDTGTDSPGNDYVTWLAIDTGDTDGVSVDIVDSPTTTGTWDVTAPGFEPQSVILAMGTNSVINTVLGADPMALGFGAFDDTNESCISWSHDRDAATINIEARRSTTDAVNLYDWGGTSHDPMLVGTFSSFDSSGYNMSFPTYVDATARKFLSIAIKTAATGPTIITRTLSDSADITDLSDPNRFRNRLLADQIDVQDVLSRFAIKNRVRSDSIDDITDFLIRTKYVNRVAFDEIGSIIDALTRYTIANRVLIESIDVNDSVIATIIEAGVVIITRTLSEQVSVEDLKAQSINRTRILLEQAGVDDLSVQRSVIHQRQLFDLFETADAALRSVISPRVLSDQADLTDYLVRQALLTRLLADDLGLQDQVIAQLTVYQQAAIFILMAVAEDQTEFKINPSPIIMNILQGDTDSEIEP